MKIRWFFVLGGLGVNLLAQERPSILPPLPQPKPPQAAPAPPARATRIVPMNETIPDWSARWDLARALSYLNRYDESLTEYRKIIAERADDAAVRQEYGQVLLWAGKIEESFAELSIIPVDKLSPAAAIALGDTYVARKAYDRAGTIFRAQLQRQPDDHLTRFKLAEILSWTKRYDESLALYRAILAALPEDAQVRRRYALVLLWAGRIEESAAELKRTLSE